MSRRRLVSLAGTTLVLTGFLVTATPLPAAHAEPDDPADIAIAKAQEPMDAAVAAVEAQVAARPDWIEHYGGSEMYPEASNRMIKFYWSRDSDGQWRPDGEFFALVGSFDNNSTVNTSTGPSAYSEAELKAAAEAQPDTAANGVGVGPEGLIIEVAPEAVEGKNEALRAARARAGSRAEMKGLAKYILRYEAADAPVELATRQNDSSATPGWKGGARVRRPIPNTTNRYQICSSSFGVTASGYQYMITAAHCFNDGVYIYDGVSDVVGTSTNRTIGNDFLWVKVSNASARVFVGPWNTTSGDTRDVVGTVGSARGSYTCQSGASSGTICATKIRWPNYWYKVNGKYQWGVLAERNGGLQAVAGGDSGGPVIKNTGTYPNVRAAGMISAGSNRRSCTQSTTPDVPCYSRVIYKRIEVVRSFGTLLTR